MCPQRDPGFGHGLPSDDPPPYEYVHEVSVNPQSTKVIIIPPTPLVDPPSDGLIFSVCVMVLCCLPLGMFALIRSVESRSAAGYGDRATAEKRSKEAHVANRVGLGIGLIILTALLIMKSFIYNSVH